jgi:uncharacterized protein (DUF433 family)
MELRQRLEWAPPGGDTQTLAPGVESTPGVCGGEPVLENTRFPIRVLVLHHRESGGDIDDILAAFPDLSRESVEAGMAYYDQHKEEIDEDIRLEGEAYERAAAAQRAHFGR